MGAGSAVASPGAEVAVVTGDPSGQGLFILLARIPEGHEVPPHTHPTAENVTVLSGTSHISLGEAPSRNAGEALPVGGVVAIPAEHPHMAWTDEKTVIEVTAEGPFEITTSTRTTNRGSSSSQATRRGPELGTGSAHLRR